MQVQHLLQLFSSFTKEVSVKCRISAGKNIYLDHLKHGSVLLIASALHYPNGRNLYPPLWEKAGFPFLPWTGQIKEENVFEQQPELYTIRGKVKCLPQSSPAVLGLWSSLTCSCYSSPSPFLIPPYLCTSFCPSCVELQLIWWYILPSKPIFRVVWIIDHNMTMKRMECVRQRKKR